MLLKERNMLMTMEEACQRAVETFPNPERLDKVQDSMDNLESVVRERNRAYHLLETGETGERPAKLVYNRLGKRYVYNAQNSANNKFANPRKRLESVLVDFSTYFFSSFSRYEVLV